MSASEASMPSAEDRPEGVTGEDVAVLVEDVSRVFQIGGRFGQRKPLQAVQSVSLAIRRGELLGLVGESGCGKTTLGRIIAGLESASSGSITFLPRDQPQEVGGVAGDPRRVLVQAVFQDPSQSLNPRLRVGRSIAEPLRRPYHLPEVRASVEQALRDVLLEADLAERYPHQLSGGQQQRVAIARAIVGRPDLVVYDEAVSALDSVSQRSVTAAIRSLTRRLGLAGLFISHDMHVVEDLCDRIAVMYAGRVVEVCSAGDDEASGAHFRHPYSTLLFESIPIPDLEAEGRRPKAVLVGGVPDPMNLPPGCPFAPRCPIAQEKCGADVPLLLGTLVAEAVACFHPGELRA